MALPNEKWQKFWSTLARIGLAARVCELPSARRKLGDIYGSSTSQILNLADFW